MSAQPVDMKISYLLVNSIPAQKDALNITTLVNLITV